MLTDFIQNHKMKLEYINNISNSGKYKDVVSENIIRLFDFNQMETDDLSRIMYQTLIIHKQELDLSTIAFIEHINCTLILRLSSDNKGITKTNESNIFICKLTEQSFAAAIEFMRAASTGGYAWLCDTSNDDIDFLYSVGGTW